MKRIYIGLAITAICTSTAIGVVIAKESTTTHNQPPLDLIEWARGMLDYAFEQLP